MKLNLNAKELLALHNLLYERYASSDVKDSAQYYEEKDLRATDDVHLRQVYSRLRAIIVAGLTNPNKTVDPVDSWLKHEQAKIDDLKAQNEGIKAEAQSLVAPVQPADILTDDDDEVPGDLAYPSRRKGPPPPNMPHSGKRRGHRR